MAGTKQRPNSMSRVEELLYAILDSNAEIASKIATSGSSGVSDPLAPYNLSDKDESSSPQYFGFLDKDSNWCIMKVQSSTITYCTGTSGYGTAWTNRAAITYVTFDQAF